MFRLKKSLEIILDLFEKVMPKLGGGGLQMYIPQSSVHTVLTYKLLVLYCYCKVHIVHIVFLVLF